MLAKHKCAEIFFNPLPGCGFGGPGGGFFSFGISSGLPLLLPVLKPLPGPPKPQPGRGSKHISARNISQPEYLLILLTQHNTWSACPDFLARFLTRFLARFLTRVFGLGFWLRKYNVQYYRDGKIKFYSTTGTEKNDGSKTCN